MSHSEQTAAQHGAHAHGDDHAHGSHHVLPRWLLLGTWAALMSLTGLTVFSAQYHLGAFDVPIAMTIATIKGLLVMLIFMHLAWDKGFHSVLIFGSLLFVWLFVGFLLIDRGQYQGSKTQFDRDVIQSQP
ncbi:MAG: cytochrome C oxidase subunit IV family protein [Planctomycetota bacterium]